MAKIYVSSSWSNPFQQSFVEELRNRGHEVYDFRCPNGREEKSVWESVGISKDGILPSDFKEVLQDGYVRQRFDEHKEAMLSSDVCVLLLPCNKSSHIEAGIMKASGKTVLVYNYAEEQMTPELMYLFFDGIYEYAEDLFAAIHNIDVSLSESPDEQP